MNKTLLPLLLLAVASTATAISFFGDDKSLDVNKVERLSPAVKTQYELAVCSVNTTVEKNPAYYHLPRITTKLLCNVGSTTRTGTFAAFYTDGWRLIQVVGIDSRLATKDKTVPYSLMYLERIKAPVVAK